MMTRSKVIMAKVMRITPTARINNNGKEQSNDGEGELMMIMM